MAKGKVGMFKMFQRFLMFGRFGRFNGFKRLGNFGLSMLVFSAISKGVEVWEVKKVRVKLNTRMNIAL
jgi:hypothetical protein